MTYADVAEGVEHAFMGENAVGERELGDGVGEWLGHGYPQSCGSGARPLSAPTANPQPFAGSSPGPRRPCAAAAAEGKSPTSPPVLIGPTGTRRAEFGSDGAYAFPSARLPTTSLSAASAWTRS